MREKPVVPVTPMAPVAPSPEQIEALRDYAACHGRYWKSKLRHAWMYSRYDHADGAMNLQQVRNQFGPAWLVRFKLPPRIAAAGAAATDSRSDLCRGVPVA